MVSKSIQFNKPYLTGKEQTYIAEVLEQGFLQSGGPFTKMCEQWFERRFGFSKAVLTTSCTDALEMISLLLEIEPGDEIILPSYTFVSTASAFEMRGAKLIFADSCDDHPNMDVEAVRPLITDRTKAIVVMHYTGVACNIKAFRDLCDANDIFLVEDAAQAIDAKFEDQYLGGIGHFSAFSFHETKNIQCGEGGLLVVNDERFHARVEFMVEKGTDRAKFLRGEVPKYGWVDIGSSYQPSELVAAFLLAQLEELEQIQSTRIVIWERYYNGLRFLEDAGHIELPVLPEFASNNGHLFYFMCSSIEVRQELTKFLRSKSIAAAFHFLRLHQSEYFKNKHDGRELPNSLKFEECLLRLPFHNEITPEQQQEVIAAIGEFFS